MLHGIMNELGNFLGSNLTQPNLNPKHSSKAETACQCHGIKHLIKYGFNAISHICIQWSMTLVYISSCVRAI